MMAKEASPVRVRFAPSPTGPFHLGGARTALFNWLFSRQNKGQFVLRVEDTDKERSDKRHEEQIFESLRWLSIEWDEGPIEEGGSEKGKVKRYKGNYGPYRQSERTKIYKNYLQELLDGDKAYYCYCSKDDLEAERQTMIAEGLPSKYSGHCRNLKNPPDGKKSQLIRFKMPEVKVEFKDLIRGKVTFDASLFGDVVIARLHAPERSDGGQAKDLKNPLYNFAVVVDDHEMKISHVIRGEEHLSNTPKQILFQRALGFREPAYAHLPLILNPDRSKLSKRYADTSLLKYRDEGFLPEATTNFLVLLGWHPKDDREIFTLEELVKEFDIRRVQKAGAVFNEEKFEWLNSEHLRRLDGREIIKHLAPLLKAKNLHPDKKFLLKVVEAERERMKTLTDFIDLANFFFELPDYEPKLLVWKKSSYEEARSILEKISSAIEAIDDSRFTKDEISSAITKLIDGSDRGVVFWPIRVAVSGQSASPDPVVIIDALGKEETLRRLKIALGKLTGLV